MSDITITCATIGDLFDHLELFPRDMKVCGIGGGAITVTIQECYPDRLWFE